jgi:hypothetical protein
MTFHDITLATPAPQSRVDGWSPQRQRLFVETLAATGIVRAACEAVQISERAAYGLRLRRDGTAFRLGWDAAILIARARLADTLLARAIEGQEEVITRDEDGTQMRRHRHDNRLAMSMLSRLDRMADQPAEGSDAALARIVAQDFTAYCDLLCPPPDAALDAPEATLEPQAEAATPAQATTTPAKPQFATTASVALFIAQRVALLSSAANIPQISDAHERCELPPEPPVRLMELPPEEAAQRLRGVWFDDALGRNRTDFPPPPGFDGDQSELPYDPDFYERDLTPEEEAALDAQDASARLPYELAAIRARAAFFAPPESSGLTHNPPRC